MLSAGFPLEDTSGHQDPFPFFEAEGSHQKKVFESTRFDQNFETFCLSQEIYVPMWDSCILIL